MRLCYGLLNKLVNNRMKKPTQVPRIVFLDYLRIIAFVSVLIGHTVQHQLAAMVAESSLHPTPRLLMKAVLPVVHEGGVGVVLFFFISGYIITCVSQRERPLEFAVKRIFRIYPLYIFAVLFGYLLTDHANRLPFKVVLLQCTLLGDFIGLPFALGGVEWTLRIEIYFYFIMGILAILARRSALASYRRVPVLFFLIVFVLGLAPPFTNGSIGWGGGWPATGIVTMYFPFLLVGSLLYLYEQGFVSGRVVISLSSLFMVQYFILMPKYQPLWADDHHALIALFLFLTFWFFRHTFVSGPVLLFLSSLTYSVYLFHNWFFFILRSWLEPRLPFPVVAGPIALIGLFSVCIISMYVVETPGIKIGKALALRMAHR